MKKRLSKINSMTGFARTAGLFDGISWVWEIKSVNGKGIDIRCRLPQGLENFDKEITTKTKELFKRGNFNINLEVNSEASNEVYEINAKHLKNLINFIDREHSSLKNFAKPQLDNLLNVRGVIEKSKKPEFHENKKNLTKNILMGMEKVLNALLESRSNEGYRIHKFLFAQLISIRKLHKKAIKIANVQSKKMYDNLREQVLLLTSSDLAFSDGRLEQEVVLLVAKADIREELDRLQSHIEAADALIKNGGVIGRQLDFLCQEFNREVNTICSKSSDIRIVKIGLEMKLLFEQFREQVQNIE